MSFLVTFAAKKQNMAVNKQKTDAIRNRVDADDVDHRRSDEVRMAAV